MAEIICPICKSTIQLDGNTYANIAMQVRDREFSTMVNKRVDEVVRAKCNEITASKNAEIERLKSVIELEKEKANTEKSNLSHEKDQKITELEGIIAANESNTQLQISQARQEKQAEIDRINKEKDEAKIAYDFNLKAKDEELQRSKNFNLMKSTKMVGESLEKFCETEFEKIRAIGFENAIFEKDNDTRTGSKGDYIFKELTDDGIEIVSIMFEMKNEVETTEKKHKNEDFFKELDKDRREKNCEYAVLVSMLEGDSELYNVGIVDVSHKYEKMYVIRPQFFIPIITLLRNAAKKSLGYRQELEIARKQNIDVDSFEQEVKEFKEKFGKNFNLAAQHYNKAIEEIEKTIRNLTKTKEELQASMQQLEWANKKADDLSIRKLAKNSPMIAEAIKNKE